MKCIRRFLLICFVMVSCIGCDQLSKHVARSELSGKPRLSYLFDTIRLELFENQGAFLSLGAELTDEWRFWIFTVGAGTLLIGLFLYVLCTSGLDQLELFSFSLVLGGGVSNLLDRCFRDGSVTDFLNTGIGSLRTGVFNLADMAITGGVILLLLSSLRHRDVASDK